MHASNNSSSTLSSNTVSCEGARSAAASGAQWLRNGCEGAACANACSGHVRVGGRASMGAGGVKVAQVQSRWIRLAAQSRIWRALLPNPLREAAARRAPQLELNVPRLRERARENLAV